MFTKAFIPYNGYYSTPFCRWQGAMANDNAIVLAGTTANRWVKKKNIDPTIFDYMYFGITVAQHRLFYSHTWGAAMLVDAGTAIVDVVGASISASLRKGGIV